MINISQRVNNIFKRMDTLDLSNLKVILDFISDLDNNRLYYVIKVVDKYNKVIQSDTIYGTPRDFINKYTEKYNQIPRLDFYNIVNGKLEYQPTILEREQGLCIETINDTI